MRSDDVQDTIVDTRYEAAAMIVERSIPEGSLTISGMQKSLKKTLNEFLEYLRLLKNGLRRTVLLNLRFYRA